MERGKNDRMNIGLLTFHAAHNYGSVLQAYATQKFLEEAGYECEIINYRLPNQRKYYNKLYSFNFGFRKGIQKLLRLPENRERIERVNKFENFIEKNMRKTGCEYVSYEEIKKVVGKYDVLISGSDQVWNENSVAEFYLEPVEAIYPYYLRFDNFDGKRVAFSSSFGTMKTQQIEKHYSDFIKYDYISVREQDSAIFLSEFLNKNITTLLDPTLLIDRNIWFKLACSCDFVKNNDFLLIYSLGGMKDIKELIKYVKDLRLVKGKDIYVIAPLAKVIGKGVYVVDNCGPKEFLYLIAHAKYVITNSFHGTAFSINFGVSFVSIHSDERSRIAQLLEKFNLSNRRVYNLDTIGTVLDMPMNYEEITRCLKRERKRAKDFIVQAIKETM